jgi:hypothetical protein
MMQQASSRLRETTAFVTSDNAGTGNIEKPVTIAAIAFPGIATESGKFGTGQGADIARMQVVHGGFLSVGV